MNLCLIVFNIETINQQIKALFNKNYIMISIFHHINFKKKMNLKILKYEKEKINN